MTFIEWVDANLPRIKERMKTPVRAEETVGKNEAPSCRYRVDFNPNNTAPENCCFIGYCIAPENYHIDMDTSNSTDVTKIVERFPKAFGGLKFNSDLDKYREECSLLNWLQAIHDEAKPGDWAVEFTRWLDAYQTYKQSLLAPRG